MMNRERFEAAAGMEAYLDEVEKNRDFWRGVWERVVVPPDLAVRAAALPGRWNLLALSEDWCGDAVNLLPLVARLAEHTPGAEFRVLGRDTNPDLMDAHLTGSSRSIPVVIIYDENFVERGWWGPRPGPIQSWVVGVGLQLSSEQRYREIRTWYARDRGRTTLEEVLGLLEGLAPLPSAGVAGLDPAAALGSTEG